MVLGKQTLAPVFAQLYDPAHFEDIDNFVELRFLLNNSPKTAESSLAINTANANGIILIKLHLLPCIS